MNEIAWSRNDHPAHFEIVSWEETREQTSARHEAGQRVLLGNDGRLYWYTPKAVEDFRRITRLNAALGRSFWKEAQHGGFW
jgi:hypothetical protein